MILLSNVKCIFLVIIEVIATIYPQLQMGLTNGHDELAYMLKDLYEIYCDSSLVMFGSTGPLTGVSA